jgi:hypothetical protein
MKPSTIIGGASSQHVRNAADFYATPPECTIALLENYQRLFEGSRIWEPACGDGAISKVLEGRRLDVISTDLHDRGYGKGGMNFLTADCNCGSIITNPPFSLAANFIARAASKEVPFAMLLKSTYWHASSRYDLFEQTKPMAIIAMTWRPAMSPERGKAATMDFIWTVWDRKPSNKTEYILQRKNKL